MNPQELRASILVATAAALGVALAACGSEMPAKAPNIGVFEVSPDGRHPPPSGSVIEASCSGGAGHNCGAMKDEKKSSE